MGFGLEHYNYTALVTDKYGHEYFVYVIAYDNVSAKQAACEKLGFKKEKVHTEILEKRQRNRL